MPLPPSGPVDCPSPVDATATLLNNLTTVTFSLPANCITASAPLGESAHFSISYDTTLRTVLGQIGAADGFVYQASGQELTITTNGTVHSGTLPLHSGRRLTSHLVTDDTHLSRGSSRHLLQDGISGGLSALCYESERFCEDVLEELAGAALCAPLALAAALPECTAGPACVVIVFLVHQLCTTAAGQAADSICMLLAQHGDLPNCDGPAAPPSPLPANPMPTPPGPAVCGIGGDTRTLSQAGFTCPQPGDGCEPTSNSTQNQASCADFCSQLQRETGGIGCCLIRASCDAGPCAPVACCGFQDCIELLS